MKNTSTNRVDTRSVYGTHRTAIEVYGTAVLAVGQSTLRLLAATDISEHCRSISRNLTCIREWSARCSCHRNLCEDRTRVHATVSNIRIEETDTSRSTNITTTEVVVNHCYVTLVGTVAGQDLLGSTKLSLSTHT